MLFYESKHSRWKYKVNWCNSIVDQIRWKGNWPHVYVSKKKKCIYIESRLFYGFWNLTESIDEQRWTRYFPKTFPSEEEKITAEGRRRGEWRALFSYRCAIYWGVAINVHVLYELKARYGLAAGQDELRETEVFGKISQKCRKSRQRPWNICVTSDRGQSRVVHSPPSFDPRGRPRSWELMGVQRIRRALRDLPPPLGDGVFFCRVINDQVSGWPHDRKIQSKNRR